jgi:two-component system chemotaxis response regulator CheY
MNQEVLIVDDSPSIRRALRFIIEGLGYKIVEAPDGKEALSVITSATNLVITDVNMPEMNGIDLVKSIRAGEAPLKTVPIIILTTESQADMKQKGKDAGATAWVVKPFPPEEIISAVKRLIG